MSSSNAKQQQSNQTDVNQELMQSLFDHAPEAIILVDKTGLIFRANQQAEILFGYSQAELKNMSVEQLLPEQFRQRHLLHRANYWADPHLRPMGANLELFGQHKDGHVVPIDIMLNKVETAAGKFVIAIIRDLTQQKQAVTTLQLQSQILNNMAEGVNLVRATDGTIVYTNPAFEQMFGYEPGELIGHHISVVNAPTKQRPEEVTQEILLTLRKQDHWHGEIQNIKKDGTLVWCAGHISRFDHPEHGALWISVQRDITESKLMKEALQKSEGRFRALFEQSPDALFITSLNDKIVDVNPAACELTGYSREELQHMNVPDIQAPEARGRLDEVIRHELQLNEFIETLTLHRDGGYIPVEVRTTPLTGQDQNLALLILRDITTRKNAERELLESRRLFQNAFQTAPIGMCLVSLEGRFIRVNAALCSMLGYNVERFLQLTFQEITYPDDLQEDLNLANMLLQGEIQSYEIEKRYIHQNGTIIWATLNAALIHDIEGHPLYFISQIQDITEQKLMTLQLERGRKQYQMLFEEAPVMYVTTRNEDGVPVVTACNQAFLKTLGYEKHDVIDKFLGSFYTPESRKMLLESGYQEALEGRLSVNQERDLLTRDGRVIHTVLQAIPLFNEETNEVIGTRAMFTDITDRRAMEQQLNIARETAEEASRAKSQFLANMSHELRTPLNAILGFSQLMENDLNLTQKQRAHLEIINRSGTYLLRLINDVLEITKIDAGKVNLHEETFNITAMLHDIQNMFYAQAMQKQIGWRINIDDSVPMYLYGDEKKFYQILVNLVGNAIKFTNEGEVLVNILEVRDPANPLLECIVSDTGTGISEQEINLLFQPFTQTTSGQESKQGSGLGLTIVKHYVQLMGGSIQVYSDMAPSNSGTVFAVHIPFKPAVKDSSLLPPPSNQAYVIGLAAGQSTKRILIVDDSNINRLLLKNLLQPIGLEVREASNGLEAVQIWESWQPHLIFMDLVMPVMDGYEAIKNIRAKMSPTNPSVIIAITADVFAETKQTLVGTDIDDLISKPFKLQHIFYTLEKYLNIRFLYNTNHNMDTLPSPTQQPIIKDWSEEWESQMRKELLKGDYMRILELIDELAVHNPQLALRLRGHAEQFDYEKIEGFL